MPTIACPNKIPCDCTTSPYANLSSELPDEPFFIATVFSYVYPPLGTAWDKVGCVITCESTVSQQAADLCAAEQAYECATAGWQDPGPEAPSQPVPPAQRTVGRVRHPGPFFNIPAVGSAMCPDGSFSTFLVPAGTFAGPSQAAVDATAVSYANLQAQAGQICLSALPAQVCVGQPFNATITAMGAKLATGLNTNNWTVVGLPPGLTANQGAVAGDSIFITGTPTSAGNYMVIVTVADPVGDTITRTYMLAVFGLINQSLPPATVGQAYLGFLNFSGSLGTVTFSLAPGSSLPAGLTLNPNGTITGTPTGSAGTFSFNVMMADSGM